MTAAHGPRSAAAKTGMLIRRPPEEVFEAFVNPEITTQFWFTRSSGRLEAGSEVQWEWEMYGMSIPVEVRIVEPSTHLVVQWPAYDSPTTIEWTFAPHADGTFVTIVNHGFTGDDETLLGQVADSTEGFALVLAGAKALLEHGIRLNLVGDRFPKGVGGA